MTSAGSMTAPQSICTEKRTGHCAGSFLAWTLLAVSVCLVLPFPGWASQVLPAVEQVPAPVHPEAGSVLHDWQAHDCAVFTDESGRNYAAVRFPPREEQVLRDYFGAGFGFLKLAVDNSRGRSPWLWNCSTNLVTLHLKDGRTVDSGPALTNHELFHMLSPAARQQFACLQEVPAGESGCVFLVFPAFAWEDIRRIQFFSGLVSSGFGTFCGTDSLRGSRFRASARTVPDLALAKTIQNNWQSNNGAVYVDPQGRRFSLWRLPSRIQSNLRTRLGWGLCFLGLVMDNTNGKSVCSWDCSKSFVSLYQKDGQKVRSQCRAFNDQYLARVSAAQQTKLSGTKSARPGEKAYLLLCFPAFSWKDICKIYVNPGLGTGGFGEFTDTPQPDSRVFQ